MDVGRSKPDVYHSRAARVHVVLLPLPDKFRTADSKCRVCVVCVYVSSRCLCKWYLSKLTPSHSVWLRENGEGCLIYPRE